MEHLFAASVEVERGVDIEAIRNWLDPVLNGQDNF